VNRYIKLTNQLMYLRAGISNANNYVAGCNLQKVTHKLLHATASLWFPGEFSLTWNYV